MISINHQNRQETNVIHFFNRIYFRAQLILKPQYNPNKPIKSRSIVERLKKHAAP